MIGLACHPDGSIYSQYYTVEGMFHAMMTAHLWLDSSGFISLNSKISQFEWLNLS